MTTLCVCHNCSVVPHPITSISAPLRRFSSFTITVTAVLPTNHSSPDNYPLQDMVLVLKDPRYTALLKPHKALTLKNIEQKQQIKELQNQISHTTNHLTLKRSELSLYHQYMELLQQRLDAANDQLSHAHAQLTSANTLNADNLRMLGYYQNQCNSQRQALQDAEQRNLQQMREIVSLQQKLGSAWPRMEVSLLFTHELTVSSTRTSWSSCDWTTCFTRHL